MATHYKAPWGRSVRLVTIVVSMLLVGIPVTAISQGNGSAGVLLVAVIPLLIWMFTLPFMILGYELTDEELRISRLGWKSVFALRSLHSAEYKPYAMARSLRLFGNGGLFCVCGRFRNRELGHYRAFVTDPNNAVVLRFADKTIVISPDRPEEFTAALNLRKTIA